MTREQQVDSIVAGARGVLTQMAAEDSLEARAELGELVLRYVRQLESLAHPVSIGERAQALQVLDGVSYERLLGEREGCAKELARIDAQKKKAFESPRWAETSLAAEGARHVETTRRDLARIDAKIALLDSLSAAFGPR